MKKSILFSCFLLLAFLSAASAEPTFTINNVLAEAPPDECYAGLGIDYPNGISGYNALAGPPCPATVITSPTPSYPNGQEVAVKEKYNQTYVWGLTRSGDSLWFGTGANVYCTTANMYIGYEEGDEGSRSVCEYGDSMVYRKGIVTSPGRGDFRPPKMYEYILASDGTGTGTIIDRTPTSDPLLKQVMGIRSAGSHNGVVFFAGGARVGGGIIMFAFNATTKQYLGSYRFTTWGTSNMSIRKWLVVKNRLYTAVGSDAMNGGSFFNYGYMLRWTGSVSNPFSFVTVGRVIGHPRELAEYVDNSGRSRIATISQNVYLSPPITSAYGLPTSTATWSMKWSPWSYEPDQTSRVGYGGGGIHQFDGWLYWGTTMVPYRAGYLHENCTYGSYWPCYGEPQNDAEENELLNGTWRATTLWRGRNLESATPEIQLLYGESELPMYTAGTRSFETVSTGWTPLYGHSGYEDTDPNETISPNMYNSYTWTMDVAAGKLFIGTYDSGGGVDLWRIDNSATPAKREDGNGVGDRNNYGIRTMAVSADGQTLYLGMATNVNLVGNASTTRFGPGWEIRALKFE